MKGQFSVFRGMKLRNETISQYMQMVNERESIALIGFTSTHKNREIAERDAFSIKSSSGNETNK